MNRVKYLLVLAFCLPLTARADDASLHDKARQMVTILHTDRMVTQIADNLKKRTADAAERALGPNPTPEQKTKLADFNKKVSDAVDAAVGWQAMEPAFTQIYAKTFTEQEMDGIIAFYKSPAGMAFLEKTPSFNAQVTQLTQPKIAALEAQLNQLYKEFRQSSAAAPAAGAPK